MSKALTAVFHWVSITGLPLENMQMNWLEVVNQSKWTHAHTRPSYSSDGRCQQQHHGCDLLEAIWAPWRPEHSKRWSRGRRPRLRPRRLVARKVKEAKVARQVRTRPRLGSWKRIWLQPRAWRKSCSWKLGARSETSLRRRAPWEMSWLFKAVPS